MNKICKEWDGQWQGIMVASDGNCYFSSSTHSKSHGAGLHKFDPRTYEVTVLSDDMTEVCGESNLPGRPQQGKIHSDIERGFIRAEIVAFEDLKNCGSMAAVKEKGLFRLEGKDYVMQDGDVTMFRFNV